jgi:hypothetical protein
MAKTLIINVEPKRIIEDGMQIKLTGKSYLRSYPEFVQYFKNIDVITEHNLVIGINFVYGWMPTIFEFTSDNFTSALNLLNAAKSEYKLSEKELTLLKSLFNNSLVGTTKLLHFINPNRFAIWDSRVFKYLTGEKPHANRIGNPLSYLAYLEWARSATYHEEFPILKKHLVNKVGYEMTDYRIVDLVAYSYGGVNPNTKI